MNLDEVQAAISRLLDGRASPEETGRLLGAPAARLLAYRRGAAGARRVAIESMFPACKVALCRDASVQAWAELVEAYFRVHPMHSFEMSESARAWPAFLAARPDTPPWVRELADLEWLEWMTETAEAARVEVTPALQVNPTLTLRRYGHDLVAWIEGGHVGAPERVPTTVGFWRDLAGDPFRNALAPALLEAIDEVRASGGARDAAALAALVEAEILLAADGG